MHELQGPSGGGALNIAQRKLRSGHELAVVSGEVFARRLTMGVSGIFDPANANHAELTGLVPEKSDAAAASSLAMLERCGQLVKG